MHHGSAYLYPPPPVVWHMGPMSPSVALPWDHRPTSDCAPLPIIVGHHPIGDGVPFTPVLSWLLNPLMPSTSIVSPPRKFLVSTKLVRLGRCCKTCNVYARLWNYSWSARGTTGISTPWSSPVSPPTSLFLVRFSVLNLVHTLMPGAIAPLR